ncbi:hypothetical protein [Vibrio breoganii]|uniref:hypothetical protein n=1 Tax=Vibrio breoganii TaxID=553239 RepID=UPI000C82D22A|nr:hypothetical protein [Vibrio breoganii]PMF79175.1 hypothetical protein BCV08_02235 [Vibrio breoganii]PMH16628.1 hypothetical protein BCU74_01340 [Vibrio breoganii]PMM16212.1 hypothetical protein BCT60_00535 [Vibrio breoganii]TKG15797.1 hypothetical protein FCV81_16925 [Vibrio breoganii]
MDYISNIVPLLKSYIGMELKSLSGRSNIFVNNVDSNGFSLTCADGQSFTESHRRAKIVFEQLQDKGVIHVDAALENSGSRRNIPETLLANLPFVEYGKINQRQHLFLRVEETHELGTLKQKSG